MRSDIIKKIRNKNILKLKDKIRNKKLKKSSRDWLQRQINDPFVIQARKEGYRSRAAFKILEIQEKFKIINKDSLVIDLGTAPGGWSQVISKICKRVIAIDLLAIDPIPNVDFIKGDFLEEANIEKIKSLLENQKVDVIISDMAPNTCGIKKVDHLRITNLMEEVFNFSKMILKSGGNLVFKTFQGGTSGQLFSDINKSFKKVNYFKPNSSRKESPEHYVIALGYK